MSGKAPNLLAHAQAEASKAARHEKGDRLAVRATLVVMAARDPLLAEGLFRMGMDAAARQACGTYAGVGQPADNSTPLTAEQRKVVRETGGAYRAARLGD